MPASADLDDASAAARRFDYGRRHPEQGTLYQIVRDNLQTLYAAIEDGFASPLPQFVRTELEHYLDGGLLCRGFAWLKCEACHEQRLVAFSCKGRGFCPSVWVGAWRKRRRIWWTTFHR